MAERISLTSVPDRLTAPPAGLRVAPACQRNAGAIADVLADWLREDDLVIEVGCGTGQHAAWMTTALPGLRWLPTDVAPDFVTISAWRDLSNSAQSIHVPVALDATIPDMWPSVAANALFTANTLHIMSWSAVEQLFANMHRSLSANGLLLIYGPFHDQGKPTSDGNERFDAELRAGGSGRGIRDRGAVQSLAAAAGWLQVAHYTMPANNELLIWRTENGVKHG
ncbi:MAG: DUF938 domain-containing protein [Pseudomonadota bacterium]